MTLESIAWKANMLIDDCEVLIAKIQSDIQRLGDDALLSVHSKSRESLMLSKIANENALAELGQSAI